MATTSLAELENGSCEVVPGPTSAHLWEGGTAQHCTGGALLLSGLFSRKTKKCCV